MCGKRVIEGEGFMMQDGMFTFFVNAVNANGFFYVLEKDVYNRSGVVVSKKEMERVKEQSALTYDPDNESNLRYLEKRPGLN